MCVLQRPQPSLQDFRAALRRLDHPTQQRRMVAFLLEGSAAQRARIGLLDQKGWNEVMIPPNLYTVRSVQQTPMGEVVTLQMTGDVTEARRDFNARMQKGLPDDLGP